MVDPGKEVENRKRIAYIDHSIKVHIQVRIADIEFTHKFFFGKSAGHPQVPVIIMVQVDGINVKIHGQIGRSRG